MPKPTVAMPIEKAYEFAATNGLQAEAEKIRSMRIHPRLLHPHDEAVRKSHFLELFESRNLLDRFIAEHWPAGATDSGQKKRAYYNSCRKKNEKLVGATPMDEETDDEGDDGPDEQAFALEADLRDFLANNLGAIEPGLRLYREGQRTGIEFPIDNGRGRIDLLALDGQGAPVVIELKLSRGRNETIGQLLYYMGWVDQHLGKGRSRGIIVAKEISEDLVVAVRRVPGIMLFRYKIAMTVEVVGEVSI